MSPPIVVCHGRQVDDHLRPMGDRCSAQFRPPGLVIDRDRRALPVELMPDRVYPAFRTLDDQRRPPTARDVVEMAISAGWALAPADHPDHTETELVGMCPRCRRPGPEVAALAKEVGSDAG